MEVQLADDSVLKLLLADERIEIVTPHGTLLNLTGLPVAAALGPRALVFVSAAVALVFGLAA